MKQWSDQYLQEAIGDEITLAHVHPKLRKRASMPPHPSIDTDVFPDPPKYGSMGARHARTTPAFPLPRWRRDWRAAGQLIGELGLEIRHDLDEGTVSVSHVDGRRRSITERYMDHPSKDAAIWTALVRSAIQVCTAARGN